MRCRPCIAALLVLALAPAASAAQRQPRFYHLGVGFGPAVTDGKSDVAIPTGLYSAAFYDFGARPPAQTLMSSPLCVELPGYSYPSTPDNVGEGEFLWDCVSVAEGPLLEDVASRAVFQIPQPPEALFGDAEDAYHATIGSSWIRVLLEDHGVSYPAYFNRKSGSWQREPASANRYPNVDAPALAEALCRPLLRVPTPRDLSDVDGAPFEQYFYERPYGVATPESTVNGLTHQRITVQRCGSTKVRVIARCGQSCGHVQFSAGLITWEGARGLRAYAPRTGDSYSWPFAAVRSVPLLGAEIVHTRQRLIVSVPPRLVNGPWTIWAGRMPKH